MLRRSLIVLAFLLVVLAGQNKLRNGQQVKIDNSVLPPTGGPLGP
jgi:hypothetical protein